MWSGQDGGGGNERDSWENKKVSGGVGCGNSSSYHSCVHQKSLKYSPPASCLPALRLALHTTTWACPTSLCPAPKLMRTPFSVFPNSAATHGLRHFHCQVCSLSPPRHRSLVWWRVEPLHCNYTFVSPSQAASRLSPPPTLSVPSLLCPTAPSPLLSYVCIASPHSPTISSSTWWGRDTCLIPSNTPKPFFFPAWV